MVVREYIIENFKLDDKRIRTFGRGKTSEAGDNGNVEIIIYPLGSRMPGH